MAVPLLVRTSTAPLHLAHPVEGVCHQVRKSPVQVHGGQAALVPIAGRDQLGQATVHGLPHTTNIQLPWKTHTASINQSMFSWKITIILSSQSRNTSR